eukprot:EG_transcript_33268
MASASAMAENGSHQMGEGNLILCTTEMFQPDESVEKQSASEALSPAQGAYWGGPLVWMETQCAAHPTAAEMVRNIPCRLLLQDPGGGGEQAAWRLPTSPSVCGAPSKGCKKGSPGSKQQAMDRRLCAKWGKIISIQKWLAFIQPPTRKHPQCQDSGQAGLRLVPASAHTYF